MSAAGLLRASALFVVACASCAPASDGATAELADARGISTALLRPAISR